MKELTKDQYDYWDRKAVEHVAHNKDGLCQPFCLALRDAIFTLKERDKEIATLKSKK